MKCAVVVDMYGCPNRCRHCWLPHNAHPHIPLDEFIDIADRFRGYERNGVPFFTELLFQSWYREPDYPDNYRQLWALEHKLSMGMFPHYELANVRRLLSDRDYAPWLKNIGVENVQLTFFGTEANTDYFSGRKGAYRELLGAIIVLLESGIAPRIQLFPFRTTVGDFEGILRVFDGIGLERSVRLLGRELDCFINTPSPVGEAVNLENIYLDREGLQSLPSWFIEKTLRHFSVENLGELWKTEAEWLSFLREETRPLNDTPDVTTFMIDTEFDVYPNCGEIAPWWWLGNIKTEDIGVIIDNYLNRNVPGLRMNYDVPVGYFANRYGEEDHSVLWTRPDLVHRWMRREGVSLMEWGAKVR